jgi:hypothetical protein
MAALQIQMHCNNTSVRLLTNAQHPQSAISSVCCTPLPLDGALDNAATECIALLLPLVPHWPRSSTRAACATTAAVDFTKQRTNSMLRATLRTQVSWLHSGVASEPEFPGFETKFPFRYWLHNQRCSPEQERACSACQHP